MKPHTLVGVLASGGRLPGSHQNLKGVKKEPHACATKVSRQPFRVQNISHEQPKDHSLTPGSGSGREAALPTSRAAQRPAYSQAPTLAMGMLAPPRLPEPGARSSSRGQEV